MPLSGKATVDALADQWGKIMAFAMHKQGLGEIVINADDIRKYTDAPGDLTIVVQELNDGLHVQLLPLVEAKAMAEKFKHRGFGKS